MFKLKSSGTIGNPNVVADNGLSSAQASKGQEREYANPQEPPAAAALAGPPTWVATQAMRGQRTRHKASSRRRADLKKKNERFIRRARGRHYSPLVSLDPSDHATRYLAMPRTTSLGLLLTGLAAWASVMASFATIPDRIQVPRY